jgi:hypothetical protein
MEVELKLELLSAQQNSRLATMRREASLPARKSANCWPARS